MRFEERPAVDQPPRKEGRSHPLRVAAAALVAAGVFAGCQGEESPVAEPATTTTITATSQPAATTVATSEVSAEPAAEIAAAFLEAYGNFDLESAASYLAPDADLSQFEGGRQNWQLGNQWLEAQGFELILDGCDGSGGSVICPFDYHGIRSDQIGLGPFGGSHFAVTVEDGEIASVALVWDFIGNGFSNQVWEPFARWVAETHPEDAAVMYTDGSFTLEALTEESIQLWEERSKEYVEFVNGG